MKIRLCAFAAGAAALPLIFSAMLLAAPPASNPAPNLAQLMMERKELDEKVAVVVQLGDLGRAMQDMRALSAPPLTDEQIDAKAASMLYGFAIPNAYILHDFELAQIRDPAKRAALLAQAQADRKAAEDRARRAAQNRAKPDDAVTSRRLAVKAAISRAISPYLRDSQDLGLKHSPADDLAIGDFVSTWTDAGHNAVLSVRICLDAYPDEDYPETPVEKLDGKFPVGRPVTIDDSSPEVKTDIGVKAGIIYVHFHIIADEYRTDPANLLKMLKSFVDLNALAALKAD